MNIRRPVIIFKLTALFFLNFIFFGCCQETKNSNSTEWVVAQLLQKKTEEVKISDAPKLVTSPYGEAVYFDGTNDALFLDAMPLELWKEFTVEMIFSPDPSGLFEQRILHIGEVSDDRMLLEIRATQGNWYFDGFVASKTNKKAVIDEKLTHPLGDWYHVAFVVSADNLTTYVNGEKELSEPYIFEPINTGRTSIGVRLNKKSWFKGAIYKIKITPKKLSSEDFTLK